MYYLLLIDKIDFPLFIEIFVFPVLTFVLFLITTFLDVNAASRKIVVIILSSALFISCFEAYSSFQSNEDNSFLKTNVSEVLETVKETVIEIKDSKNIINQGFENQEEAFDVVKRHLKSIGATDLEDRIEQSQKARRIGDGNK